MIKGKSWCLAVLAAALLIVSGLGCSPASSTGTSPTTPKKSGQPDNKDKSVKPPQNDPG
jgi:hypothetical protein